MRRSGVSHAGKNRRRKGNIGRPEEERVILNISGELYETYAFTLLRFPESLLGDPDKSSQYYCFHSKQYFFDRNKFCFDSILHMYQVCTSLLLLTLHLNENFSKTECSLLTNYRSHQFKVVGNEFLVLLYSVQLSSFERTKLPKFKRAQIKRKSPKQE